MSITATDSVLPWRAARAASASSRCCRARWFASPVSGSLEAWAASLARSSMLAIAVGEQVAELHQPLAVVLAERALACSGHHDARPRSRPRSGSARRCSTGSRADRARWSAPSVRGGRHAGVDRALDVGAGLDRELGPGRVAAAGMVGPGAGDHGAAGAIELEDPGGAALQQRRRPRSPPARRSAPGSRPRPPRSRRGEGRPAARPAARTGFAASTSAACRRRSRRPGGGTRALRSRTGRGTRPGPRGGRRSAEARGRRRRRPDTGSATGPAKK